MSRPLSLYIHIPFCKTICTYCNFPTFANKLKWIAEYVTAVVSEIEQKAQDFPNCQIRTIYFGGGTPSLIDTIYIEKILTAIQKSFKISNFAQISIELEANPETITLEKVRDYQQLGIGRLSLGVQTLDSRSLFKVARSHNREQALAAMDTLRTAGFGNFGVDLIMGMPYQNLESFTTDVKTILDFSPSHLSTYFLSYDTKKIDTFIADAPLEEEQIAMYWRFQEISAAAGFEHYEVSNYARPGFASLHNQAYWNQQEYLGLGLGAHSFFNNTVWENSVNFEDYLKNPGQQIDPKILDTDELRMDYIMLKLRQKKGVNLAEFAAKFGEDSRQKLLLNLRKVNPVHYLFNDTEVSLTNSGFLFVDSIQKTLV